jgi:hypothetical protein
MQLSNMNAGPVAEKELLAEILAGADKRITVAEFDRVARDQGWDSEKRIAGKCGLQRKGLLVEPGQEGPHFAALRAEATKGQTKLPVLTHVEAGGHVDRVGPARQITPAPRSGYWFGQIPKQTDILAAQHVYAINAGADRLLDPQVNWLLQWCGIKTLDGPGGTLTKEQQQRVRRFGENPMEQREIDAKLYAAGIACQEFEAVRWP